MDTLAEGLGMRPIQPEAKRARDDRHNDSVCIHTALRSEASEASAARAKENDLFDIGPTRHLTQPDQTSL